MWAARLIFPWEQQVCSQWILSRLGHSSEKQDRHSQEVKARVIGGVELTLGRHLQARLLSLQAEDLLELGQ